MSLEAILSACKAINAQVEGIAAAYDHTDVPDSLNTAGLPCVIALPRNGILSYFASDGAESKHIVRLLLVGAPSGQGDVAQRMAQLVPFVALVRNAYAQHVRLGGVATVAHAELSAYEFRVITYAGNEYAAIEFTLNVTEKEQIAVGE